MDLVTVHATRGTITLRYGEHSVTDRRYLIGGGDIPQVAGRNDSALSSLPQELAEVAYPDDCDHAADGSPLPGCPGPDRKLLGRMAWRALFDWKMAGSPLTYERER